jgi:hypothetical protein
MSMKYIGILASLSRRRWLERLCQFRQRVMEADLNAFGHFGKHSTMNGTTTSISGGRTRGTVDFMPFRLTTMGITSNRRRRLSHKPPSTYLPDRQGN